jgi:hypothetical protein
LPDNHVEPPDVGVLLTGPNSPRFWTEVGNSVDWVKYVWTGPAPDVLVYLNQVYRGRQFSSQTIYTSITEGVANLKIPDAVCGQVVIHESGPFSPNRAYLQIRREFSEFLVCAAPVGNSFFVTARKIDRFRHVKWWHYLLTVGLLMGLFVTATAYFGQLGGIVCTALVFTFVWSLFRYASQPALSWLGEHLPEVPMIGALYLRWFRPDTYFRQDLHAAFMTLVDNAIRDVVAGLDPAAPIRPATESQSGPILKEPI